MNNAKRLLAALVLTGAAMSFGGAAQATEEIEAYDHHLTVSDKHHFELYWSK